MLAGTSDSRSRSGMDAWSLIQIAPGCMTYMFQSAHARNVK